jgi:hypothetical protein
MSSYFYVFNTDGFCTQKRTVVGTPSELQVLDIIASQHLTITSDQDISINQARLINGILTDVPPTPPTLTYQKLRNDAYPAVVTQLDMLWHSMDSGEIPKATQFYNTIKTIKDAYPKS